jgi:hypothetical protein
MDAIHGFLAQYPILMHIVVVMGMMRMVFKPLTIAIQSYVDNSDDGGKDNAFWEKVKANPIYKGLAFVLDYVGSIKIPVAPKV